MPFLGRSGGAGKSNVLLDAITTSATATYNLTKDSVAYFPTGATSLMVSLNGVTQAPVTGFTVNGSAITFDSALASTDVIDYIVGSDSLIKTLAVSDASITTSKIADNSITTNKLVDGTIVNADLANNAVDIAKLDVTDGTAGQYLQTNGSGVLGWATVTVPSSYPPPTLTSTSGTVASGTFQVVSAGGITITLPASPSAGDYVVVKDGTGAAATTNFTVARNGSNIASSASDLTFDQNFAEIVMVYVNSTIGWSA